MSDAEPREQRLRELFDRAIGLAPAAREQLLRGIDDELLAERLRALLLQDDQGTSGPLRNTPATALEALRRLGHYELLRELGHGGMGSVFLARQVEPIERLVALKVIADDRTDSAAVQRFEQERQTLATLNHLGIAQLFEAGTAADGTLFFAMEYVRGEPITTYCDRRSLTVNARLALFVMVCDAVQHAHQRAVLHRDLKPGNILVTEVDGQALPKIIDFGVARALARAPGHVSPDDPHTIVGTWQYMSPEQMAPDRQDTDTRSDVYSLGVVLYELLTGQRPFATTDDPQARQHLRTQLQDETPPLASKRLQALTDAERRAAASHRGCDPAQLVAAVREDLDAITARALARDRNDRYGTAWELRDELQHHLQHLPVRAVDGGGWYRLRRFARRKRLLAAALLILLLGVFAGGTGAVYGLLGTQRALTAERAHSANEQLQLRRRSAVLDFFELVVFQADPGTGAAPPTLREVLDALTPTLERRFAGKSFEEAAVRAAIGRAYLGAGEPGKAEVQLRRAWELTAQLPEAEPTESLLLLGDLARVTLKLRGMQATRDYYEELLRRGVAALQASDPVLARTLQDLAAFAEDGERHAEFLTRLDQVLQDAAPKAPDARVTNTLLAMFGLVLQDADYPANDELLMRLEAATRNALQDEFDLQLALGRQAEALLRRGAIAPALRLAKEVGTGLVAVLQQDHWLRLQMERLRGLCLSLSGEEAAGETALLNLQQRLRDLDNRANEQARAAANCMVELCARLETTALLEPFLTRSLARWQRAADETPELEPWWPARVAGLPATATELAARLVAATSAASRSAPTAAVLGALLLRAEHSEAALEALQRARQLGTSSTPELLADLVLAEVRLGHTVAADQAFAALSAMAASPRISDDRIRRARRRAAADLGR